MWVVGQNQCVAIDCDLLAIEPCQSQEIGLLGKYELIGFKAGAKVVLSRGSKDEMKYLFNSITIREDVSTPFLIASPEHADKPERLSIVPRKGLHNE